MLRRILLPLILNYLHDVTAALVVSPTPTSKFDKSAIVRRDEKLATVTMGDMGQYYDASTDNYVEARSVAIFPTGLITDIPEDGFHVVLGSEVQASLDKVARENCADSSNSQKCVEAVHKELQDSSLSTHTKRFVLITAFTVGLILEILVDVAIASIATAAVVAAVGDGVAPERVKFDDTSDNGVLGQINTLTDVTAIAIATGTDNELTLYHRMQEILVEEMQEDDGDHKKGDIKITFPEEISSRLKEYLQVIGLQQVKDICDNPPSDRKLRPRAQNMKRMPTLATFSEDCSRAFAELGTMLDGALQEGALILGRVNPQNPMNPANNPNGGVTVNLRVGVVQVVTWLGRNIDRHLPTNMQDRTFTILAILWAWYEVGATIWLEVINQVRLKDEDAQCPSGLVCVDDNFKGYVKPTINMGGSLGFQTGVCESGKWDRCACEEVSQPIFYEVEGDDYFEKFAEWKAELAEAPPTPSCDSNNKIELDPQRFKDSVNSACQGHDELRRLKKRGSNGWAWDKVEDVNGNTLQWAFDWNDKGGQCSMKCEDAFKIFEDDNKSADCGIASFTVDRPNPATCWSWPVGAPRGQKEVDHEGVPGTSVEQAIEQFCDDIDGQKVEATFDEAKNQHARRWGFAEWGVPDRRSFWLRAQYASRPNCQGYEWPHKTNCKAAMKQGMEQCSPGQGTTGGMIIGGIGCIDYSIHLTDNVFDDSPPWKEPTLRFPPPLDAPKPGGGSHTPNCGCGCKMVPTCCLRAIDAYCQNGNDIQGWQGHMFNYPPEGQTQFYPNDDLTMLISMGAQTVNNGDQAPYADMKQCLNYDWKLGKDDFYYDLQRDIPYKSLTEATAFPFHEFPVAKGILEEAIVVV
ncbi:hypothetical protein K491DRAFT_680775 [Lophiostoma macrostomum CBS 122681]|uniref:Glycoside hydrolase family 18 protein n=1 Tax=Lophiostoma macrostomum CBS 122681 TaxID=1314788 RepID=A0A6A6T1I6_9PLEO|nr:hypothetical protein K491DRAFT_680775 [Lophiostoma macrostomum CBS 122681]